MSTITARKILRFEKFFSFSSLRSVAAAAAEEYEHPHEEAQEINERSEQGRHIGERGGGKDFAGGALFLFGEDPLFDEHLFGAAGGIEFDGQGHEHEQRGQPVKHHADHGEIKSDVVFGVEPDEEVDEQPDEDEGQGEPGAEIGDRHEHRADLIGDIPLFPLHDVPDLVRRHGDRRHRVVAVGGFGEVDDLPLGVEMVAEAPLHPADGHVENAVGIQEPHGGVVARHVGSIGDVVLAVRRMHPHARPAGKRRAGENEQQKYDVIFKIHGKVLLIPYCSDFIPNDYSVRPPSAPSLPLLSTDSAPFKHTEGGSSGFSRGFFPFFPCRAHPAHPPHPEQPPHPFPRLRTR